MKPDERMPDFWDRIEARPASQKDDDDLAALLEEYNHRRIIQRRIERLGTAALLIGLLLLAGLASLLMWRWFINWMVQ